MRAMLMRGPAQPLEPDELPIPEPKPGELLLRVRACGICRTDLHLLDGDVEIPSFPRVLGHQIVATVADTGQRVGVPWMAWTCGGCEACKSGHTNLCERVQYTGCHVDGGFAEYTVANERACVPLPEEYPDEQAAPLLCAGIIGYRALRMCGDAERIGMYGFGAAAHICCQIARWQGRQVFAFTRAGDDAAQALARELGAVWAGGSDDAPPEPLEAAIIFAPVGELVPIALRALAPAGVLVCGGIHMSDIPRLSYRDLWYERVIRSVTNATVQDGRELMSVAARAGVRTHVTIYPLEATGAALEDLRAGRYTGAGVVTLNAAD